MIISDSSRAIKKMEEIEKRLNNLPWRSAAEIVQESIVKNFDTSGRFSTPNSIWGGTSKWSRKHDKPWPILKKSGNLRNSNEIQVFSNGFMIINNLEYAAAQNYGYQPRNLGASPFAVVQLQDMNNISNMMKKYIIM